MAALFIRRMRNEFEANNFLQGGIRLPLSYPRGGERVFGLDGLTLVFTTPAGTVTFADATGAGLLVKEILAQIVADVSTLKAYHRDGVIFIVDADISGNVVLDGAASTARPVLGLPNGNLSGTKYNPPAGAAPRLLLLSDGAGESLVITTEE